MVCKRVAFTMVISAGTIVATAIALAIALSAPPARATDAAIDTAVLQAKIAQLEKRVPPPELGQQMLELQIRHDRLWWAGKAGNWNLAYYMVSELGETLRGIGQSNGDAPELQPGQVVCWEGLADAKGDSGDKPGAAAAAKKAVALRPDTAAKKWLIP